MSDWVHHATRLLAQKGTASNRILGDSTANQENTLRGDSWPRGPSNKLIRTYIQETYSQSNDNSSDQLDLDLNGWAMTGAEERRIDWVPSIYGHIISWHWPGQGPQKIACHHRLPVCLLLPRCPYQATQTIRRYWVNDHNNKAYVLSIRRTWSLPPLSPGLSCEFDGPPTPKFRVCCAIPGPLNGASSLGTISIKKSNWSDFERAFEISERESVRRLFESAIMNARAVISDMKTQVWVDNEMDISDRDKITDFRKPCRRG